VNQRSIPVEVAGARDCAPRRVVVHVGPDRSMVGGVASVLRTLSACGSASGFDLRFVSTIDVSGARDLRRLARGLGELRGYLRRGIALVHLHTASKGSFWRKWLASRLAVRYGTPYVVHVHGGGFSAFASSGSVARRWAVKAYLSRAAAVLVLNDEMAAALISLCPSCSPVIVVNPVVVPARPAQHGASARVLFIGRLVQQKGIFDLLAAIALLQSDGCDWRWALVGSGIGEDVVGVLEALPRPELVDTTGAVEPEGVASYLEGSEIFCLPSHREGLPVALLEAMAEGLACVASRVGGIPDVVIDGETGLLVDPGDVECLVSAISTLMKDSELRAQLGLAARESVKVRFSPAVLCDSLSAIYERISAGDLTGGAQ